MAGQLSDQNQGNKQVDVNKQNSAISRQKKLFTSSRPLEQARDNAVSLFLSETLSMSDLCCSRTSQTSTWPAALARINGVSPVHYKHINVSIGKLPQTHICDTLHAHRIQRGEKCNKAWNILWAMLQYHKLF